MTHSAALPDPNDSLAGGASQRSSLISPNPMMAERFLRLLYPGARGFLTITRKQGDTMLTDYMEMPYTTMDQVAAHTCKLAASQDVWFGVGLRAEKMESSKRGKAESVIAIPGFYADIDIRHPAAHAHQDRPPDQDAAMAILRASGLEPSLTVESGHGLHAYWLFPQLLTIDTENRERVKRIAANLHTVNAAAARQREWKIDNVSDLARILRPAGTINWKQADQPKLVTFEHTSNRYDFAEIEEVVGRLSAPTGRGFVGFDGFASQPEVKNAPDSDGQSGGCTAEGGLDAENPEFPPAYLQPIVNACAWMRHCRDDAAALSEPEWYSMLSIVGRCEEGERLAHEWSSPHPRYTFGETQKKLRHALEAAGPITCCMVQEKHGSQEYCETCECRELVNSPITIGNVEVDPVLDSADVPTVTLDERVETSHEALQPPTRNPNSEKAVASECGGVVLASDVSPIASATPATATVAPTPATPPSARAELATTPATATPNWPDPKPLKTTLPPVPCFDPELLPAAFRDFALDVSDRMQAPLDFAASALLVALAGVVGRRAIITPKQLDTGWVVTPNLWGGIVSRPGNQKSPVVNEVLRFLRKIESAAIAENKVQSIEYEVELGNWETRKKAAKGNFEEPKPERPPATRYLLNDATIEKVHQILEDNPQGVLLLRDEMAGWLATLDSKGRERDRPFFLEAWNGDGSYTIDRIARGTLHVPNLCLSIFGGIQPAKFQNYLTDAVLGGGNDDGLVQRLQVVVWPDLNVEWHNVDRPPNAEAARAVEEVFQQVVAMPVEEPLRTRFSAEGQELFNEWRAELEQRLRKGKLPSYLESHLAKYRSLMPSIALLLHVADGSREQEVPLIQVQRAADWCEYLEVHAMRVYSCVTSYADRGAAALAAQIKKGSLGTRFTVRQVDLKGWSGLTSPEHVRAALGVLLDYGWVRPAPVIPGRQGGRPTEEFIINPAVCHE